MPVSSPSNQKTARISFLVPKELLIRSQKIVWGGRSPAMRVLLEKLVDSYEKNGAKIIGAIIDGEFTIEYKGRVRKDH